MVDRSKDIVKSGGENVSTCGSRRSCASTRRSLKAAVVGLPHEHWGEAVTAFVVAAPRARRPTPTR